MISVSQAAEITISWTHPTTNSDGTPLTDHAGTRVHCDGVIIADVPIPANTAIVNKACKELYVTAYDTTGNPSDPSNIIETIAPSACGNLKIEKIVLIVQ